MSGTPKPTDQAASALLQPGMRVRHWKFGDGAVVEAEEDDVVRVFFDRLGSKRLRVSVARLRRLDLPARRVLSDIEHATRLAAHLRRLALMLRERGPDAPPLPAQTHLWSMNFISGSRKLFLAWLRFIAKDRAGALSDETAALIGRTIGLFESDEPPGKFRDPLPPRKRTGVHNSHWKLTELEIAVALHAQRGGAYSFYEAAAWWLSDPACGRQKLTAVSADRAEQLATLIEQVFGLPPCPPRWGPRPVGPWKGVIHGLVMHCSSAGRPWHAYAREHGVPVRLDVLARTVVPAAAEACCEWHPGDSALRLLLRASRRLCQTLRHASIEFLPSLEGRERYRVTLETLDSGIGTECVLEHCGALRYRWINPEAM